VGSEKEKSSGPPLGAVWGKGKGGGGMRLRRMEGASRSCASIVLLGSRVREGETPFGSYSAAILYARGGGGKVHLA